jgi:microcompartment protein CcmK/EutM
MVSTVKDATHTGLRLMVARYIDLSGEPVSSEFICADGADAGIGDTVIVNDDGGAGQLLLEDSEVIIDCVIAGVVDHISVDGETRIL